MLEKVSDFDRNMRDPAMAESTSKRIRAKIRAEPLWLLRFMSISPFTIFMAVPIIGN